MINVIKCVKYPNRRIYDSENSCYASLTYLRKKITEGNDIVVLDSKTKQDVTREVLISIIMEEVVGGEPLFPDHLMKLIIQFYKNPLQGFFMNYLDQSQKMLESVWAPISTTTVDTDKKE